MAAALVAAVLFGISSVADQRSTKRVRTRRALSPVIMLDLVRQPLWLIAIATNVAAFALQVVALDFGSIAVVQPLLVFDLIFAIVIMRMVGRRQGIEFQGPAASSPECLPPRPDSWSSGSRRPARATSASTC